MVDAVVSAVVGDAVSRVISLVAGKLFSPQQQSTEAKLQRVCRLLVRIRSVVEEAKARQIENPGVLEWLSELIAGEYEGRYLLDTVGCDSERELEEDEEGGEGRPSEVPLLPQQAAASSLSLFNPAKRMRIAAASAVKSALLSRRALGSDGGEVDRVLESLQEASSGLAEFIMLLQGTHPQPAAIRRPLATNIFLLDGQMFGRHVEKEKIINFLLHDNNGGTTVGVLPIVGDIGVGKTTLVQHACDDPRVRARFPVIMLFNFSCTYTTSGDEAGTVVLRSKHVIGDDAATAVISYVKDPVQLIKRQGFGSKRFLMVFEDVDMSKKQVLDDLLPTLTCGGEKQGSKIVFTTNNRRVATSKGLGTAKPVVLKALPPPEYWFFFKAHAFAGRDVEESPRLIVAGKAIARKLNGSFFGAKIVGGLLRARPDPKFWCKVLRSDIVGLSLLGDGLAYISDLVQNLLPENVDICRVTVSKDRSSFQTDLSGFQDRCEPRRLCSSEEAAAAACMADDVVYSRVLLCKSVLPFHNLYYVASCTVDSANSLNCRLSKKFVLKNSR